MEIMLVNYINKYDLSELGLCPSLCQLAEVTPQDEVIIFAGCKWEAKC